ncbi:hypothetical protein SKAU_G00220760 [Synaphobranchus kaupii]|uniref:Alkylglycerol monooxygenase n=1 Tax=Synaphobranchus kaupii TaxID=118154 RepID=A0A9Q1FAP9_SYNKA|nr:hypothetical protein SKAU_G00220760 [Synaphobranchus kaupii]
MAGMEVETPATTLNHVVRMMFYLVTPNETSFRHVEEVPDYVHKESSRTLEPCVRSPPLPDVAVLRVIRTPLWSPCPGADASCSTCRSTPCLVVILSIPVTTPHQCGHVIRVEATPIFIGMLILELVLGCAKTGNLVIRINDGVTSVSAGLLSRLPLLFVRSLELSSYIYIWNNHRLLELPWDSAWTWWLAFLGVDLAYYWVHRFSHELNILWAAHQVHHSSEDYNLSTALRQSLTQQFTSWVLYLPMALAVPPTVFAVHIQFNLMYQFWIHTEVIRHLGPLEWVINTASHHRVHHGRNPYCIDKNYGGTLIIWDRIFGTFAPESDKVVYGLTKKINSFDPIYVQFHYYSYIWRRFWKAPGIKHKLSIIFKGPSWRPGKPRLGDHRQLTKVTPNEAPYNPTWPLVLQAYVSLHFLLLLTVYTDVMAVKLILSQQTLLLLAGYIIFTLTSLGLIIDQRPKAAVVEMLRCALFLGLYRFGYVEVAVPSMLIEVFLCLSVLYWVLQILGNGRNKQH